MFGNVYNEANELLSSQEKQRKLIVKTDASEHKTRKGQIQDQQTSHVLGVCSGVLPSE